MTLITKFIQLLPLQSGVSKYSLWKIQTIIVEAARLFPKKGFISVWGNKINDNLLQLGNQLNMNFNLESREYKVRWCTDINAWKIDVLAEAT